MSSLPQGSSGSGTNERASPPATRTARARSPDTRLGISDLLEAQKPVSCGHKGHDGRIHGRHTGPTVEVVERLAPPGTLLPCRVVLGEQDPQTRATVAELADHGALLSGKDRHFGRDLSEDVLELGEGGDFAPSARSDVVGSNTCGSKLTR